MSFTSRPFKISGAIFITLIIFMLVLINFNIAFTSLSASYISSSDNYHEGSDLIERDFDELTDKLIDSINDFEDENDLGLYIPYDDSYHTRNYEGWEEYELKDSNETITIARESVVSRLGTSLKISAPNGTELDITPSNEEMISLEEYVSYDDVITIEIPSDGTIGRYTIEGDWDGGYTSMEMFVIHDPWELSISDDERRAYVYDEDSVREEQTYIFSTDGLLQEARLDLYEKGNQGMPSMYEFSLEAISGTNDPQQAAVKLARIVAQRAEAVPTPLTEYQPQERYASDILFGEGAMNYHGEELEYTGLDLEDAAILASNDQTLDSIQNPEEHDRTKLINAWCDETSIALTALLRSVGIPSRTVSLHPRREHIEDSEMMGHFAVEVWFEDSMYDKSWGNDNGDWYVVDADEWNAEWYVAEKTYWSFIGESYSSRSVYGTIAELYFRDNPYYDYEIEHYFILGTGFEKEPEAQDIVDVTSHYKESIPNMRYGTVEKYIGRGGGDLYTLEIDETSRISLESSGGTNPSLYVSDSEFPALSITYKGYPPDIPDDGLTDDEIVLSEGTYYIGVYAPQEGDKSIDGNYGRYTLSLEKASDETPANVPGQVSEIKVEPDYGTIELSWSPPIDNGSPILYYNIYRDGELIDSVDSTNYIDRGLETHGSYVYNITAVNAMGESESSERYEVTAARNVFNERPMTAIASISLLGLWIVSFVIITKYKGTDQGSK